MNLVLGHSVIAHDVLGGFSLYINRLLRLVSFARTAHCTSGYLHESTLVWAEGCSDWQPLSSVPGISTDSQENAPGSGFDTRSIYFCVQ